MNLSEGKDTEREGGGRGEGGEEANRGYNVMRKEEGKMRGKGKQRG